MTWVRTAVLEVLKTLLWLPWAIAELIRGDFGPHAKYLLVAGVCGTFWLILFVISLREIGPAEMSWMPYLVAIALGYLLLGVFVRIAGRDFWILR